MIKCPLCTKSFREHSYLSRHMVSHTKEKPYKCHICSATFGLMARVKQHIKSVHDGIKKIKYRNTQSPLCSYKCFSRSDLHTHMRKHSTQRPFSCNIPGCGHKSKYKHNLSKHISLVHCDERPYECPIDGCNYKAKLSGTLKNHLKAHSNEKPFGCTVPECNYASKSKCGLKAHTSKVHCSDKLFKCSICEFRTKCSQNLVKHQLTHIKNKRFHCQAPNCGYASHQRDAVKRHFDHKHRKKTIPCTQPRCKFRYGSIALLKAHLKKSHGNPILKCPGDLCSYSTRFKGTLDTHISRHHNDLRPPTLIGPRISYLQTSAVTDALLHCSFPDCGYQTKFPHHYDRHIITHKKEENRHHVCPLCFCRFSHIRQLKIHLRRHVGEKPLSCSHCDYTTAHIYELSRHSKRSHYIHVIPRGKEDEDKTCGTCGRHCLSRSEFVLHSMSHLQPVVVLERLRVHVA